MANYPKQIILRAPLSEFVEHCEVYCTGACCGTDAFELHPALLLRKCIDENVRGGDSYRAFHQAWEQLRGLIALVDSTELQSVHDQVPIWKEENSNLPEFWFPRSDVSEWLHTLDDSFREASKYGGLDQARGTP